ncbi:MAG TPA: DurN family substrate-assisted peptide maturase [Ktedonobacteraceae bacterium]|nr:DurN family substrate-assisted peptide maturase [Ktedonobacteraceae bacterium]
MDTEKSTAETSTLVQEQVPGRDEIRQLQSLLAIFSSLPPDGKLHELFRLALELSQDSWLARVTPVSDASFDGLKTWLETLWLDGGLTPNEQKIVDWQNSSENMEAAVQELKAVEEKIGLKLVASVLN